MKLTVPEFISEDVLKNETTATALKTLYNQILGELTGQPDWSWQWLQDADEIFELKRALAQL